MVYPSLALVDAGPLVAYYNNKDKHHTQICEFFKDCTSQLVTTDACITEVMYAIRTFSKVQSCFLLDVADGVWLREPLLEEDFRSIAQLNDKYKDLPGDFADLSLVAVSERLDIASIVTLDSDFNVYRRYRDKYFDRIFLP